VCQVAQHVAPTGAPADNEVTVTYSIVARDPETGEMGLATQSQAFAVGSSVPWAEPGFGVIATQSVAAPHYGDLGLDLLRGGMTASESLQALRSVDPHPERRQVAMIDAAGDVAIYTGDGCVAEAGHALGDTCCALANMVAAPAVWEGMVDAFESAEGTMAERLVSALHAAESNGGDIRGRRSAALVVVRSERTGRPWRDQLVDLRVDDHPEPVEELDRLVRKSATYHEVVEGFEHAIDGDPARGMATLEEIDPEQFVDPDLRMWRATVLALAGEGDAAVEEFAALGVEHPQFLETAGRMATTALLDDAHALSRALAAARRRVDG
jgi:uncharacterized Ntn-hydrolase superfamily protein